jgi:dATP/dGTP diphosphohydrolase
MPPRPEEFSVKDSGERKQFESGMVRDTTDGKVDYSLALDGPMFRRLAVHLTKGAQKYEKRNWMQANGQEELDRFRESALRHFLQWFEGDVDEDHAAATMFNINGAEYVRGRLG